MVHVAVYADETYLDDGYIVMGGYLATVDDWLNIVNPWREILAQPPAVPYFSNHGFQSEKWCIENGVSPSDMPALEVKKLKLAGVIASSNILLFAQSRMWRAHFESAILSRVLALKKPKYELLRDPYYFCYSRLVAALLRHLRNINPVLAKEQRLFPMDIFVDENGRLAENASALFMEMKKEADSDNARLMGASAPLDDRVTIPLQCADLLVGQLRHLYASDVETEAMRILKFLPFKIPFSNVVLDWRQSDLENFANGLDGLPESHWLR